MRGSIAGLTGRGGVAGVDAATETSGGTRDAFAVLVRTSADVGGTYDGTAGTITLADNGAFDDMGGPHNVGAWDGVQENVGPGLYVGSRFLIASQSDEAQNGVYELTIMGDAGTPPVFTRISDPLYPGSVVTTVAGGSSEQTSYVVQFVGGPIELDGELDPEAPKTFANPIQTYGAGELLTLTSGTFAAKRITTPNLTGVRTLVGRRALSAPLAGDRGAIVANRIYLIPFHTMLLPYTKRGAIVHGPGGGTIQVGFYQWDGALNLGAKPTTLASGGSAIAVPASGVAEYEAGGEFAGAVYFAALWADTDGAANSFERHKAGDLFGFNGAVNASLQGIAAFYSDHTFVADGWPALGDMTLVPIVDDGAAKVPVIYIE